MEKYFRPSSSSSEINTQKGEEISKFYEEICNKSQSKEINKKEKTEVSENVSRVGPKRPIEKFSMEEIKLKVPDFLRAAQDNNLTKLIEYLDKGIDINITDDFGWTAMMCAACAGNYESVELLLSKGADTSHRDRRGNSALSIAHNTKNNAIINVLSNRGSQTITTIPSVSEDLVEEFFCKDCNVYYMATSERKHIASIPHMLNIRQTDEHLHTSRGTSNHQEKKMFAVNYKIPRSNVGFQLMLKNGWDPSQGLGPEGKGTKLPVKTLMKKDRHGIGIKPSPVSGSVASKTEIKSRKNRIVEEARDKAKEANFRREFM